MHSSEPARIELVRQQATQEPLQRPFKQSENNRLNLSSKQSSQLMTSKRHPHLKEVTGLKEELSRVAQSLNKLFPDICQQQKLLLTYREKIDAFDEQIYTLAKSKIELIEQLEKQRLLDNEQSQLAIPYLQLEMEIKTKRIESLEKSKQPVKQVICGLQVQLKSLREYERVLIEEEISLRQQLMEMRNCKRGV